MSTRTSLMLCALALLGLVAVQPAHGVAYYWDLNGATDNVAAPVTGLWDGINVFWNTDPTGGGSGTTTATTTSADDLVFSSGSVYTAGTVTVSGAQVASSISFKDNIAVTLSGGTSLTLGGSGANSGIFVLAGANQNNTISTPIILGADATIRTAGYGGLTISGGVTGAFNLTLNNNSNSSGGSGAAPGITLSTGDVNNSGTITNSGTGLGANAISANIGSNVTGVIQNSDWSALRLDGNSLTVNSGGTTLTNAGLQTLSVRTASITGTGDLIFKNNSTSAIGNGVDINGLQQTITISNVGQIINNGTGVGGTRINAQITNTITGLVQNSATSNLYLIKAISSPGAGNVIQADNTFTAATSINAGLLYAGYANALTTTSAINFNGGTLQYGVVSATDLSSKFATNGTADYSIDTNGTGTGAGVSITFGNVLAANGASGLKKLGNGTLTLTAENTYTGTTTIGGGTATLENAVGGTLQVGNGTTGSLNGTTGTQLTFGGTGTFNVVEPANSAQGMVNLTFGAGDGTVQSTYAGTPGANITILTFSWLAEHATGATGNFIVSGGANGTDNMIVLSGGVPLWNQLIDRGIFYGGSAYAACDGSGYGYVRALIYGGSDANAPAAIAGGATLGVDDATQNVQITGSITAQTTASVNTLHVSGAQNVTLAGGATLSLNGILKSGGNASTISGGAGITPTVGGNDMVIRTDAAGDALTITSPILDNGATALTKSGAGTLKLSGANAYTGNTGINQGTLVLNTPVNRTYAGLISGAGALVVTGPGELTLNGSVPDTFTGGLTVNGGTLVLDNSYMADNPTNLIDGYSKLTLGAGSLLNGPQGGGTIRIIAKSGANITSQSFSLIPPTGGVSAISTNAGAHRILVDPNGGTETRVLLGQLGNVVCFSGNSNMQASNGSGLLLGKVAGAGSGDVFFLYDTGGRNGTTYGVNLGGRLLYTPDGGTTVDFVTGTQQATSPYNIVPVGTLGTSYSKLTASSGGNGNQGPYYRITDADLTAAGGTLTMTTGGDATGVKIEDPAPGQAWDLGGIANAWTPDFGLLMTGTNDFEIKNGRMTPPGQGAQRSLTIDQYSTGTLTLSVAYATYTAPNLTATAGDVTKLGPGKLVLAGPSMYTGATYISEGILNVGIAQNGTISGPMGQNGTINFAGGTLQYSSVNNTDYSPRFNTGGGQPIKIDTFGQDVTFASVIQGTATELTKSGPGTLTLTNANTYTGPTTIIGGNLQVNNTTGSGTGTGAVTVNSSATLGGTGTISGPVSVLGGGSVAPGASVGTLTINNSMTWQDSSTYLWEINDAIGGAGTGWDLLNLGGALDLTSLGAGGLTIEIHGLTSGGDPGMPNGFTPDTQYAWTIASTAGIDGFDAGKFT
ncbi:MAG: autotransporter-associated beta strand repeat-containing protein, partial [Planctomycetota bacterium]|nr:autotransporter-associated beta strand repeat-containing protein [Planctomycetota bacterium]